MTLAGSAPTVLVVGSANLDVLLRVDRLPARGETVAGADLVRAVGGKGVNQACAAAALGAAVELIGCVGDDEDGDLVRGTLSSSSVGTQLLRVVGGHPTGTALVFSAADGENLIGVATGANARLDADSVTRGILGVAADSAVVLASLEVPMAAVLAAALAARQRGFTFVLNPAPAVLLPSELLALVTVLSPNEHELPRLGRSSAAALLAAGVASIAVTRGAAGVDVYPTADGQLTRVPAFPVDAVDTTGAGDAFNGALAWALGSGYPLLEAVRVGAAVGGLATRRVGARAALPDLAEVQQLLTTEPTSKQATR